MIRGIKCSSKVHRDAVVKFLVNLGYPCSFINDLDCEINSFKAYPIVGLNDSNVIDMGTSGIAYKDIDLNKIRPKHEEICIHGNAIEFHEDSIHIHGFLVTKAEIEHIVKKMDECHSASRGICIENENHRMAVVSLLESLGYSLYNRRHDKRDQYVVITENNEIMISTLFLGNEGIDLNMLKPLDNWCLTYQGHRMKFSKDRVQLGCCTIERTKIMKILERLK